MCILVLTKDILYVDLLVPNRNPTNTQLIIFCLSLPVGYIDREAYFCMTTKMVSNIDNNTIKDWNNAAPKQLKAESDMWYAKDDGAPQAQYNSLWIKILPQQQSSARATIYVFLDEFISAVKSGTT